MPLDATETTALTALQEAHDQRLWPKVIAVGDAWLDAKGGLPPLAAILYAEGLMAVGRIQEAVDWAAKATYELRQPPSVVGVAAMLTLARALSRAGDFVGSKRVISNATKIHLNDAEVTEKQGHSLLAVSKKWRKGWAMHEARLISDKRQLPPNMRRWDGHTAEPVSVLHEQGIGDAVLAARWLSDVVRRTGHPVTFYGPKPLHRWFAGLPDVIVGDINEAVTREDAGAAIYAMSLPFALRCDSPDLVPPPVAPAALKSLHRMRPVDGRLTVGVCWIGSAGGWHDFERSYSAEQFSHIWKDAPDVRFVNLCHEATVPEDAPFVQRSFTDIYHTGECLAACDLVITVDTAVAHLAGSLELPTLVLVPTVADWRYNWPDGKGTPFYPSMTVIRRANAYSDSALVAARAMLDQVRTTLQTACT